MKRTGSLLLVGILFLFTVAATGCTNQKAYVDGVYRAEFKDFDVYGYKDFLELTIEDGKVNAVVFNGVNKDGGFKSDDVEYQKKMEANTGTNPTRYTADMINQYKEKMDIEKVDVVAGATYSTDCFKALFFALQKNMESGNTTVVTVDNVSPKQ